MFGTGIAFVFCAIQIEPRIVLFRTLGLIVVAGGLARLLGSILAGLPSGPHRFGLVMELLVIPALLLWLGRIERGGGHGPPGLLINSILRFELLRKTASEPHHCSGQLRNAALLLAFSS